MIKPFPTIRHQRQADPHRRGCAAVHRRAPKGARIEVTCAGRGCPLREVAQATARGTKALHMPQFERALRAGTQLTITVAKPGYISKVTRITIRRGKAPARSDQCRLPGANRLIRCPR